MKKTTQFIIFCFLLSSISAFAVKDTRQNNSSINTTHYLKSGQNNQINSFTSFYSEDFTGGIPAGWQTIDTASPAGFNWKYTTTGANNGDTLSGNGTSAGNGYMIYDSDSAQNSFGGENVDLISGLINCTGRSTVVLNFNEYLKHYNDTATVWISSDGTNWVEVHNSSSGLAQYASTPNPNNVDVDITSLAANQDTVYIRFNYKADYSYYWMIDDVQLYELPNIDGSVTDIISPATSCTLLGATEAVSINLHNNGGSDINGNISATFIIDNGTPVTETVTDTIPVGGDHLHVFTATADVSAPGIRTIKAYISLTGDTNFVNDTVEVSIFNGPHLVNYSNDYTNGFEPTDDISGYYVEDANNDSVSWTVSNIFPKTGINSARMTGLAADDWIFTTCLDLDSSIVYNLDYYYRTSSTSTQAMLEIYIGDVQVSGGMNQVIQSNTQITNAFYLPATAVFSPALPGTYYIGFHVQKSDSLVGLWIDDINLTTDSGGVGIKKADKLNVSVFPNPSAGIVYFNSAENVTKGYTVEVLNTVGQIISTSSLQALNNFKVDLSNQPNGIYCLRVVSEKGITTRTISINH